MLLQLLVSEVGNYKYSPNTINTNKFLLYSFKSVSAVCSICVIGCGVCSVVPPCEWYIGGRILLCVICIYRSWSYRYRPINDTKKIKTIFFPHNFHSYFYFNAFHRGSRAIDYVPK